MNFIIWLIIGGIVGWIASLLMNIHSQQGILLNVIVRRPGRLPWRLAHLADGRHWHHQRRLQHRLDGRVHDRRHHPDRDRVAVQARQAQLTQLNSNFSTRQGAHPTARHGQAAR
jgi:hypothetical protein